MTRGYDVAELLAEIKAKSEEIAQLSPNNFTELEIRLVIDTIREAHTPERMTHSMPADAASVIKKLQVVLDRFEAKRRSATDFAASLTDEERRLIMDARTAKQR
jgi:translation initiation factor 2B subunit (eIF-2B alpha/beta/delta family)